MNKVILIGRLSKEPEVRYTANGKPVASFDIAVGRFLGKEQQDKTNIDFFSVISWNSLAEIVGNNLSKGRKVMVEGRLQNRSYETNDGQKKRITEVIAQNIEFLDYKNKDGQLSDATSFGSEVSPEEEIPF